MIGMERREAFIASMTPEEHHVRKDALRVVDLSHQITPERRVNFGGSHLHRFLAFSRKP